jgi:hypothetical protein
LLPLASLSPFCLALRLPNSFSFLWLSPSSYPHSTRHIVILPSSCPRLPSPYPSPLVPFLFPSP